VKQAQAKNSTVNLTGGPSVRWKGVGKEGRWQGSNVKEEFSDCSSNGVNVVPNRVNVVPN